MLKRLRKGIVALAALGAAWLGGANGACRFAPPPVPPVAPLTVSKETTYITEPLREDGTPDYAAWFNAKHGAGVTRENNAAVVLRPALPPEVLRLMGVDLATAPKTVGLLGGLGNSRPFEQYLNDRLDAEGTVPGIGPLPADFEDAFATQHRRASLAPWRQGDAPLIAAWLRANEAELARVEEVTRTRTRYWVPILSDPAIDQAIPSLLPLRFLGNALRVRALESAARGDAAAVRRDVVAGLRLGALLDQGAWLIDRLVAVALRSIAAEPVVALANPPLAAPGAAGDFLEALKQAPESITLDDVLDVNERLVLLAGYVDLYRAARTSSQAWKDRMSSILASREQMAAGLGQPPLSPVWERIPPWAIDWDELLSTLNRCWQNDTCAGEFSAARGDMEPAALGRLFAEAPRDREARRRIARAFLGLELYLEETRSLQRASVSWNEAETLRRMGLVSAAAAVFRVEHGRYPAEAEAFVSGMSSPGFHPGADHAGYAFTYLASADGSRFAYTAAPQRPQRTGVRGFCADSSGRLAYTSDGTRPPLAAGVCDPAATTTLAARTLPAAPR